MCLCFLHLSGPRPPSDPHGRYPENKHTSGIGTSKCSIHLHFCFFLQPTCPFENSAVFSSSILDMMGPRNSSPANVDGSVSPLLFLLFKFDANVLYGAFPHSMCRFRAPTFMCLLYVVALKQTEPQTKADAKAEASTESPEPVSIGAPGKVWGVKVHTPLPLAQNWTWIWQEIYLLHWAYLTVYVWMCGFTWSHSTERSDSGHQVLNGCRECV